MVRSRKNARESVLCVLLFSFPPFGFYVRLFATMDFHLARQEMEGLPFPSPLDRDSCHVTGTIPLHSIFRRRRLSIRRCKK